MWLNECSGSGSCRVGTRLLQIQALAGEVIYHGSFSSATNCLRSGNWAELRVGLGKGYKGTMAIQKWQYLRSDANDEDALDQKLAHYGNLGWELASVVYTQSDDDGHSWQSWELFFKMPANP
jgi:hypothetical protein